jgi:hypothetical protein
MKVPVLINIVALMALLNSGSMHNFIDTDATRRAHTGTCAWPSRMVTVSQARAAAAT